MATIGSLLQQVELPESPTARLDAELLLAAALDKPRSFLRTWPEKLVPGDVDLCFKRWLERRRSGEPVAYILGYQGFWSLDLAVEPHTLIPRPDTELLVETALGLEREKALDVLDLGTGTGAIALALASERPHWRVLGVDRIKRAVNLAERNRQRLHLENVEMRHSHWFSGLKDQRFHLIVSNPPYIPDNDPHLTEGDVRFEPKTALVAGPDGLADLRKIIGAAPDHLYPGGWLLLEHGYDQAESVRDLMSSYGFVHIRTYRDLGDMERVTLSCLPC